MITENEKKVLNFLMENDTKYYTIKDIIYEFDDVISPPEIENIVHRFLMNDPPYFKEIPSEIELKETNKVIKIITITDEGKNIIQE